MQAKSDNKNRSHARFNKQWRAVQSRDRLADGQFVYAVLSTGVYCRPSCPARKPRRDRVLFFASPAEAKERGFRACLRCRPNQRAPADASLELVKKACQQIERLALSEPSAVKIPALAAEFGMSAHQLDRAFRRTMGISPRQYADSHRLSHFKSRIRKGANVTNALYDAGYSSSSRLYENSSAQLGMTPATYGHGGQGMMLHYTIAASPLGRMLVAATERGISALYLGDSDADLLGALRREYPRAEIAAHAGSLGAAVRKILEHLEGRRPHLDLPTDVQGTAFKRRVWQELRKIPYGATMTYSQIAQAIGKPAAIRAVASACATNPVSVIVPCHRVVRKGGNLAGYRWGLERKQELLERETATLSDAGAAVAKISSKNKRS